MPGSPTQYSDGLSCHISTVLNNTHCAPVKLLITGGGEIKSTEGTTQGDSLVMAMHALAISLICRLRDPELTSKQGSSGDNSNVHFLTYFHPNAQRAAAMPASQQSSKGMSKLKRESMETE